jgi:hypothetical protein
MYYQLLKINIKIVFKETISEHGLGSTERVLGKTSIGFQVP